MISTRDNSSGRQSGAKNGRSRKNIEVPNSQAAEVNKIASRQPKRKTQKANERMTSNVSENSKTLKYKAARGPISAQRPAAPVDLSKDGETSDTRQELARKHLARATELHKQGHLDDAIGFYKLVLADYPNSSNVLNDLGVALRATGSLHASVACYRRAISLGHSGGGIWSNLGNAYRDLRRYEEAVECHETAVKLDGESPSNVYNLGLVLRDLGKLGRAHEYFEQAVSAEPDNPEYQWDRAITYLQGGNFQRGFELYDWRLKLARAVERQFDKPNWNGEALNGRTLFLYSEQGFGDMLQFSRFIPIVAEQNCRLIVECDPTLLRLFATIKGEFQPVAAGEQVPNYDLVAPLLSVPGILRVGLDNLPAVTPYFWAPEIHNLRLPQSEDDRFKVGIVWAGKLTPRDRSCSLAQFIEIAASPDVELFSLQLGERANDLITMGAAGLIYDLGARLHDFADTAAVMSQMDLVITIDSAPAHLAGGLGVPVWTLLNYAADWRWLMDRSDSPWYPTMRLFRQANSRDWDIVFTQVRQALSERLEEWRMAVSK